MNEKLEVGETTGGPAGWIAMCEGSNSGKYNIAEMLKFFISTSTHCGCASRFVERAQV